MQIKWCCTRWSILSSRLMKIFSDRKTIVYHNCKDNIIETNYLMHSKTHDLHKMTLVFTVFFQHYNNLYWYFSTLFIKNEYVAYHMCHLCHIWHIICRICIFLNGSNNRENLRFSGISATKMHLPSYENYLTFMLFGHFAVSHWCHPLAGVLEASLYT